MIDVEPSQLPWLQRFFGPGNHLGWIALADGTAPLSWQSQVSPWLAFMKNLSMDRPLILPVFGPEGAYRWYGVAETERAATQMVQEIQGFIGPSLSDFSGHLSDLSPTDPIEMALQQRFGAFVARFEAISKADRKAIERQVSLYQNVLARRPPIVGRGQRPFGRVRGDFDRALLAGNAEGAQRCLDELCESGRVTAEQRKYLEIRYLAGLGRYEELARNQGLITAVADLPLPPQIILDVVGSLYRTFIAPVEFNSELELIQETFKRHIARLYGPVFRERKGIRHPEILRAFLLYESVLDEPSLHRCESLIRTYPKEAEGLDLAERILAKIRNNAPAAISEVLSQARQAIADEDYANAVEFSIKGLPDQWAYKAMLRCAVELDGTDVMQRVLDAIGSAHETVIATLSPKDVNRLDQIRKKVLNAGHRTHDRNWTEWTEWVLTDPVDAAPIEVLEHAIVRWSVDEYIHDLGKCRELARLIGNASHAAGNVFRDALPHLIEFFVDSPAKPIRVLVPIYIILLKIIGWSGVVSGDELRLTSSVAEAFLASGPEKADYNEALSDLIDILNANQAPTSLDWALDLAELLAIYPTSNADTRLNVFMAAIAMARAWGHRLAPSQRSVISLLATDYNCLDVVDSLPFIEIIQAGGRGEPKFAGLIAIYSLSEASGQRAKDAIRVELNSDPVATERLKSLARNAEIFVFAWKKSTHQAFYCAKDARGERGLVMPSGGGAASLVQAVLQQISFLVDGTTGESSA